MDHIKLLSPVPRRNEQMYVPPDWPIANRRYLPEPKQETAVNFDTVLFRRRTRRCFLPLDDDQLSGLLWSTAKIQESRLESSGFSWTHRVTPSAGGRHPIQLVLVEIAHGNRLAELYDPLAHSLCELDLKDSKALHSFVQHAASIVGTDQGLCFCFVADVVRTSCKYRYSESLIWRDAGCLLATMHLVAENVYKKHPHPG